MLEIYYGFVAFTFFLGLFHFINVLGKETMSVVDWVLVFIFSFMLALLTPLSLPIIWVSIYRKGEDLKK